VTGARLVAGSATPSVATYHDALQGQMALAKLTRRVRGRDAEVELVDMRDEAAAGNRQPLSRRMVEAVTRTLENEEQVILYLNRRGLATFVMCRDCGKSVRCLGCSVALVQHAAGRAQGAEIELDGLVCHYCGYSRPMPIVCDFCGSRQVRALVGERRWDYSLPAALDSSAQPLSVT